MSFRSEGTGGSESSEKADDPCETRILVDEVRSEWRLLWRERIDDKVRAEGIANKDYILLFVERGTVIIATRDFKPLDLRAILRLHEVEGVERFVPPHPSVGGWHKFARTVLNRQKRARRWKAQPVSVRSSERGKNLQFKKGGRGWLHFRMNR